MSENTTYYDEYSHERRSLAEPNDDDLQGPLLADALADLDNTPAYALLIGLCEDDGLPLMLDLNHATPGHILIAADDRQHNTNALYSMLASAAALNAPEDVVFHLITHDLQQFPALIQLPHLLATFEPDMPETGILIEEMVALARARRSGRQAQNPIHILALDDLDLVIEQLSVQQRYLLDWLLTEGHELGIWVFGALETQYINRPLYGLIDGLPTRLLGMIENNRVARHLSGWDSGSLHGLQAGLQALLCTPNSAHYIWLPQIPE